MSSGLVVGAAVGTTELATCGSPLWTGGAPGAVAPALAGGFAFGRVEVAALAVAEGVAEGAADDSAVATGAAEITGPGRGVGGCSGTAAAE